MRRASRRSILAVLGASAAAAAAVPIYALAAPGPSDLPNLVAQPPDEVQPAEDLGDGRLLLRFNGYVSNAGPGALEIRASDPDDGGRMADVAQHAGMAAPGGPAGEPVAGGRRPTVVFEAADGHRHFHLKNAAEYTLRTLDGRGQVALAQKTDAGFCLEDSQTLAGATTGDGPYFQINDFCWQQDDSEWVPGTRAGQTLTMGISPGYRDRYGWWLPYQWIDASRVQPGEYLLASRPDPDGVIAETDESDNGYATTPVTLPGYVARPVQAAQTGGAVRVTLAADRFGAPEGPRRFRILSGPAHGSLDVPAGGLVADEAVVYTPAPGHRGPDEFTYAAVTEGSPFPTAPAAATATLVGESVAVAISGAPAQMLAGTGVRLSATVANAADGVAWSASAGTIAPDGLFVAPQAPPPGGVVTIRATSVAHPEAAAEARIAIVAAPASQAPAPTAAREAGAAASQAPRPGGARAVARSARQLLINQRISQAAVRRANAIEAWLDAGVRSRDLRAGAIGFDQLGPGVVAGAGPSAATRTAADPRPLRVAPAPSRAGAPSVTLSRRQLLINQRVSQAAIRRLNGLSRRLDSGLTGGDLVPGAVTAGKLAHGLRVLRADMSVPRPPASRTRIAPPSRGGGAAVALTARQLRINQRIAQAAVRRANALAGHLSAGLAGSDFADDSVVAANLAEDVRP